MFGITAIPNFISDPIGFHKALLEARVEKEEYARSIDPAKAPNNLDPAQADDYWTYLVKTKGTVVDVFA